MSRARQLAAIMFTDIQGYTALMQQNEQKAIQARDKHRHIFNSITEKHRGRILQYYGDGTLSIFDSAIDAVNCAIEMQLGFQEAPTIPVRIGIHTGDIFFSKEEIIGDSVNVASRIESLAVPGSVLISDKVFDEIKNQESIQATRLKEVKLKNVSPSIVVYAISNEGLVVPDPDDIKGKTDPNFSKAKPNTSDSNQPTKGPLDSILATKLYVPPPRPKVVFRTRLIDRLNVGLHRKLTLISAPAGFGKTTLISQWLADSERPLAWISLDERDKDATRFLTYFVAALRKISPKIGESILGMLQYPQLPPVETILTALLNDISTFPNEFILVLDDYHLIDSKTIDDALAFLLDHLPPTMHLVIVSREDPHLPLARLRVRAQLTELRAADLRFMSSEAAGFLNQMMGLTLSVDDVSALEARTEGWIAGLQMAALSLQGRSDSAHFIKEFTGSHRFVLDYLLEEVLQRQPESIRKFLLETSILERLNGPLCDVVTDLSTGKNTLETLERSNLFVIPLDDHRNWYRFHHLFADVLRTHAKEQYPDLLPILHQRASDWYEENDFRNEALHHAFAANDFDRAADLAELAWPEMDARFQASTWLEWVESLPDEWVRRRPVLSVAFAWAYLNKGDIELGEDRLKDAEKWFETTKNTPVNQEGMVVADEAQFQHLPASIATARAYISQAMGKIPESVQYAQQALDLLPENDHLRRGPSAALLGLAHWTNGNLDAAFSALSEAMNNFRLVGKIQFAISGTYGIADIKIAQGRLHEASKLYEKSLQLALKQGKPPIQGTADLYLELGALELEKGNMEGAKNNLNTSEKLGEYAALPDWPYRSSLVKAKMKEAEGDLTGALDFIQEAEERYFRTPVPSFRPIAALRARILCLQGSWPKVMVWIRERNLSLDDTPTYLNEFELLTLIRFHVSQNKDEDSIKKAMQLLNRLLTSAETGRRFGSLIEILVMQALAFEAQNEIDAALESLEKALKLAEPEGYMRIFLAEGKPMIRLLNEASNREISPKYVRRLLNSDQSARSTILASQSLVEPLSQREMEVLELIAQGLSNREISDRLFVALSTIKGHNRHIFDKLAVQRRTEAVAKARELGLIEF